MDINFDFHFDGGGIVITVIQKISNQTIDLSFTCWDRPQINEITKWNVSVVVYNKRKHINRNFSEVRNTGSNGLEFLFFAKQAIKEFEAYIVERYPLDEGYKNIIVIGWADIRRRNVYARGLRSLGYYFDNIRIFDDIVAKKYLIKKLY